MKPKITSTRSNASPIQNGQRTQSQDHEATGWISRSFKTMNTIPTTVKHPSPLDFADLDISDFSLLEFYQSSCILAILFRSNQILISAGFFQVWKTLRSVLSISFKIGFKLSAAVEPQPPAWSHQQHSGQRGSFGDLPRSSLHPT